MESFEYAIKKDVKNNPIVREVDAARHREQWKWAGMAATFVAGLLFLAWQRSTLVSHGYELGPLQAQLAAEEALSRQLRLEIETLSSPKRIELLATRELRLVQPSPEDAIVIARVAADGPPAPTVVARR
jgi:hypothetical protein